MDALSSVEPSSTTITSYAGYSKVARCSRHSRRVREPFREGLVFLEQDVRTAQPAGPFDLVLCRNMAFTYLDVASQREVLARIVERLEPGGVLVIGHLEALPDEHPALRPLDAHLRIFRRSELVNSSL